ncbi:hypothetical protein HHI36_016525 [Cryptolaemus montrouzieri]|uniref:Uncharacterized protein n=1 Tax=Cryptolaemus montrouzieri TaxID=559131 RepID=A0ABD2NK87_9CUCU
MLTPDHNEIPSHLKDVNKMRDYFSYAGQKMAPVDGDIVEFVQCNKMERLRGQSLTFRKVSEEDVINALGRIKSKCMGIDGISYIMIIKCHSHCASSGRAL